MTDFVDFHRQALADPLTRAIFLRRRRERGVTTIKLYLDDIRSPPDETWTVARTVEEAFRLLLEHEVEAASLDYDLDDLCATCTSSSRPEGSALLVMGSPSSGCSASCRCDCHVKGLEFVRWMADTGMWPQTKPVVHSANEHGRAEMRTLIDARWRAP